MQRISMILIAAFLAALPGTVVHAQRVADHATGGTLFQVGRKPVNSLKSVSLLDPARFKMSQQTIMSFSSSSRGGSNSIGMYVNTMEYQFKMPLTMRLKVAYQNDLGNLFGNKGGTTGMRPDGNQGKLYVPAFDMVYKLSRNTIISFQYRDYTGMQNSTYSPYRRAYDPYGLYR